MLRRLRGRDAEEAWTWFARTYEPFVARRLSQLASGRASSFVAAGQPREDLLREFWAYAWERHLDARADEARRFRPYLFGCLKNFVRERTRTDRPRGVPLLDVEPFHGREEDDPSLGDWAHTVLCDALAELRRSNATHAEALVLFYGIDPEHGAGVRPSSGADVGRRLGVADVHGVLHSARKRLRRILERRLLDTVERPEQLDEEVALLRVGLSRTQRAIIAHET